MARKYNTRHPDRGRSNYPKRLAARGLTKAPTMTTVESLRSKQTRPEWLAVNPWVTVNLANFAAAR